jgi:hypothetical protein
LGSIGGTRRSHNAPHFTRMMHIVRHLDML